MVHCFSTACLQLLKLFVVVCLCLHDICCAGVWIRFQGGPMSRVEADEYEKDPNYEIYILMRSWDEQAKVRTS
jgi:hypothetical protein